MAVHPVRQTGTSDHTDPGSLRYHEASPLDGTDRTGGPDLDNPDDPDDTVSSPVSSLVSRRYSIQLPIDYTSYEHSKPFSRSSVAESSHEKALPKSKRSLVFQWLFDLACLVLGAASMVTIVALLVHLDQTPLTPWIWGITLNGTISVISFFWRASTGLVIIDSIGQLKWLWFQTGRRLADMRIFDEASRGGASGFHLLVKIRWTVARLAGLLILLSVLFEPFMQQLVSYPTNTTKLKSDNATITRGVTYTMESPDQSSHRKLGQEDQYLADNILGSVLLARYTQSYQAIRSLACPSRSNCSWDIYPTLGLCYKCAQLTDTDWETTCGKQSADCSYSFHGITDFSIKTPNVTGFNPLNFESKEVPRNVSQRWFNISNPILTIASLKVNQSQDPSESYYYPPGNATVCSFYPCVYTVVSSSVNGQPNFDVMTSWRNESSSIPGDETQIDKGGLPDIYMTPNSDDLGMDSANFNKTTYYIPGDVATLMRTTIRSILLVRTWNVNASGGGINSNFSQPGYGNSDLVAMNLAIAGANYEQIFDGISLATTFYIRSIIENRRYLVNGYITSQFTIINVRWSYIIFPAALYALTVLVFSITVYKTRALPFWKNSVLPLIFASRLRDEAGLSGACTEEDMRRQANTIPVKVETVGDGMELKMS